MAFPLSLATQRLTGERLTAVHLPDLCRLQSNPRYMEHLGGVRTTAETEAYLERNLAHWDRYDFGLWLLRDVGGGDVIGTAVLRHLTLDGADEVEVGYGFQESHWGRGLATEIAAACLVHASRDLRLSGVVGLARPSNMVSHHVLRKIGLAFERETDIDGVRLVLFRSNRDPR